MGSFDNGVAVFGLHRVYISSGSFDSSVAVFGLHRVCISWVVLIMVLQCSGYTGCVFHG